MAKPYPILPLNFLDELHSLNCMLGTYQRMIESTIRCFRSEGMPGDIESFLLGLDDLFQPVMDGYLSIERQVNGFRAMGVVGTCQLPDDDSDSPVT